MRICKPSCPSNRSPLFADKIDVVQIRTERKVGVVSDRRKTGICGTSLYDTGETELKDVRGSGRQTVVKLECGVDSEVRCNVGKKKY